MGGKKEREIVGGKKRQNAFYRTGSQTNQNLEYCRKSDCAGGGRGWCALCTNFWTEANEMDSVE